MGHAAGKRCFSEQLSKGGCSQGPIAAWALKHSGLISSALSCRIPFKGMVSLPLFRGPPGPRCKTAIAELLP